MKGVDSMKSMIRHLYFKIVPWGNSCEKINKLYAKMNNCHKKRKKVLAQYYCYLIEKKYQCRISPGSIIGKNLFMPHPNGVIIGGGCKIGDNVTIYQQVTIGQNHEDYPVIGNNVIIYAGAKIIGGVKIGDDCIIGANAVVTKDAPRGVVLGGVPAKVIKNRSNMEKYR